MKRVLTAVVAVPVLVLTLAAPAAAAKPDTSDRPQGCENSGGPQGVCEGYE